MPVPVNDETVFRDFPGQRLVAGSPGADRGDDGTAGAGAGDIAGPDGLPGAASLPRGSRGEGGITGDAAGHLGAGRPGAEFLPDQARGARAEHRPCAVPKSRTLALSWRFWCSSGRSPVLADDAVDNAGALDLGGHIDRLTGLV